MITLDSTLQQLYETAVGKDLIDTVLQRTGSGRGLLENPLVMGRRLATLRTLADKAAPGLLERLIEMANAEPDSPPPSPAAIAKHWWKELVAYQIYPRSFRDSNGDGIGDLQGIIAGIPYLKALGVNAVWLSPIYDSPNDDMGYDIRNYKRIMREFGTLKDFDAMAAALHEAGIRLIMDLVVNHTSDEHQWFKKALKDPAGPYKDYYIWGRGKAPGQPPNNWTSFFGGPAWNYYPEVDAWALHLFSKKQMDLNWENPALRAEVFEMMRWWQARGVDGFRLDVINLISKDSLEDGNPAVGKAVGITGIEHYVYGPALNTYLKEMHSEALAETDAFTVGEMAGLGMELDRMLTAEERKELDMAFNFDHMDMPGETRMAPYQYDLRALKPYFEKWQTQYGNNCWPALVFENHDNPRFVSKVNPAPELYAPVSKLLATLQLTLKGTPFLYQGQELGMTNTLFGSIGEIRDVEARNQYLLLAEKMDPDAAFEQVAWGTRDHARTPMQWSDAPHAGFTGADANPWLAVNPNYPLINAKQQRTDPDSVFSHFKRLIALRKENKALVYGSFEQVFSSNKDLLCYFRIDEGEKFYIEANLTDKTQKRPGPLTAKHEHLCGNYGGVEPALRPFEANVYRCG